MPMADAVTKARKPGPLAALAALPAVLVGTGGGTADGTGGGTAGGSGGGQLGQAPGGQDAAGPDLVLALRGEPAADRGPGQVDHRVDVL
jgi:hypothetical protein